MTFKSIILQNLMITNHKKSDRVNINLVPRAFLLERVVEGTGIGWLILDPGIGWSHDTQNIWV